MIDPDTYRRICSTNYQRGLSEGRREALEAALRAIDEISWDWPSPRIDDAETFMAAIRALMDKRE